MELLLLTGIVTAILTAGFFAGAEAAFVTVDRLPVELRRRQGDPGALVISRHLDRPAAFMATLYIGLHTSAVIYGLLIGEFLQPAWIWTCEWLDLKGAAFIPFARLLFDTFIAATALLVVFFFSRALFKACNTAFLIAFGGILGFYHWLFGHVRRIMAAMAGWILKYLFNVPVRPEIETFARADFEQFYLPGAPPPEHAHELNTEMLEAALGLPNLRIRQCLVPRNEIEGIDIDTDLETLRRRFMDTKLSKLVVYEGHIDRIRGYVHQLDLFRPAADIAAIMLPIPAVPESMTASEMIERFSRERRSIAWVVDEFGGTAGIITMEDLLEEIFGDIRDEYDTDEFTEQKISDTEFIFSGRLEIDHLNDTYGFGIPVRSSETLSGFIIAHHESIPRQRQRIVIDQFEFEILNVSATRIDTVRMRLLS